MTFVRSVRPLYSKDQISAEWQAHVDLAAGLRVAAAYTRDDLTTRTVAPGIAGSDQGMGRRVGMSDSATQA